MSVISDPSRGLDARAPAEPTAESLAARAPTGEDGETPLKRTLLSVVIPAYNEEKTIQTTVARVLSAPVQPSVDIEIICVNDCSKDNTKAKLDELPALFPEAKIQVFHKPHNQGKGAAVRDGFAVATGDLVIVQDADLEYDPDDFPKLLEPLLAGEADVVFGSRFVGSEPHRVLYFWHMVANKMLTLMSNMMTNLNLTDMEVGYKVFRKSVLDRIKIKCNRFGFEPEITAKVAKLRPRVRIYECSISYHGRSYEEGKKITWRDGVRAVLAIIRFRFSN